MSNSSDRPARQQVHLSIDVDTPSAQHAASTVRYLIRTALEGRHAHADLDEPRSRIAGWSLIDDGVLAAWEPYVDSGIPEMVAEMFPPEPRREHHRLVSGEIDEDAFEEAHEQWRDRSLELAVAAAGLPELLARLERAERVRDGVRDVLARHRLPERPRRQDFPAGLFGAQVNEEAYARAVADWQQRLRQTVTAREAALERVLADGEDRTMSSPGQFQAAWVPRDLVAVTALRSLLEADPARTGRLLDEESRSQLEAMLDGADPDVCITDPDDPDGPELYEGPASEAHRWVPAGVYEATGLDGQGEFRVVVGRTRIGGEGTASAAFPPAGHDSRVLDEISGVLETAADDIDPADLVRQVNTLVAATGRGAGETGPSLSGGALLSELLAERDRQLPDAPEPRPGNGWQDPGLSR